MARDLDLASRVEFLGAFPVSEVQGFLGDAAAVIMPSIWEDVAPLAAYEQLMHGQLVIASDIGGLGEIVDGVSLKFPVGDSHALAACMRRVLDEPEMARDLKVSSAEACARCFHTRTHDCRSPGGLSRTRCSSRQRPELIPHGAAFICQRTQASYRCRFALPRSQPRNRAYRPGMDRAPCRQFRSPCLQPGNTRC